MTYFQIEKSFFCNFKISLKTNLSDNITPDQKCLMGLVFSKLKIIYLGIVTTIQHFIQ